MQLHHHTALQSTPHCTTLHHPLHHHLQPPHCTTLNHKAAHSTPPPTFSQLHRHTAPRSVPHCTTILTKLHHLVNHRMHSYINHTGTPQHTLHHTAPCCTTHTVLAHRSALMLQSTTWYTTQHQTTLCLPVATPLHCTKVYITLYHAVPHILYWHTGGDSSYKVPHGTQHNIRLQSAFL